jgi:hypothetical protein
MESKPQAEEEKKVTAEPEAQWDPVAEIKQALE